MVNIFTYGSLMFDPVWTRVVAGSYERADAILPGYDRKAVQGETYPVLIPSSPLSQVQGVVYFEVLSADLSRLDIFEGRCYFRKTEQIITEDKNVIAAEVYVLKEEYYAIISHKEWDPVHFSTTNIHLFLHSHVDTDEQ
ncbi:MAG: hypothetical protein AMJ61_01980 [Desulfobacterales bacterium SG8_35_2]|nr:MAG: hypothetical protein AMJ61_01980 [Desulfobacterales bacterium SG8_35_2]